MLDAGVILRIASLAPMIPHTLLVVKSSISLYAGPGLLTALNTLYFNKEDIADAKDVFK